MFDIDKLLVERLLLSGWETTARAEIDPLKILSDVIVAAPVIGKFLLALSPPPIDGIAWDDIEHLTVVNVMFEVE